MPKSSDAPSERTRIKRLAKRAHYDRETAYAVLDAGILCHVAYVIDAQPFVTPTCHWRDGDYVYWHGSAASGMLRAQQAGISICLTVSHLDGLILARSGFNHSVNYRSIMVLGMAEVVDDAGHIDRALEAFMERIAPGRWQDLRPITAKERKATTVLRLKIDEFSVKVRDAGVADNEEDYDHPVWAGVIPVTTTLGVPQADPRLAADIAMPDYLAKIAV